MVGGGRGGIALPRLHHRGVQCNGRPRWERLGFKPTVRKRQHRQQQSRCLLGTGALQKDKNRLRVELKRVKASGWNLVLLMAYGPRFQASARLIARPAERKKESV